MRAASAASGPAAEPGTAALVVLLLLKLYKLLLSPLFAGSCRFLPSCSEYAGDAVRVHGALKGSWLALRRLSRCHPLGRSGYDPVPEAGPSRSRRAPAVRLPTGL